MQLPVSFSKGGTKFHKKRDPFYKAYPVWHCGNYENPHIYGTTLPKNGEPVNRHNETLYRGRD